MGNIKDHIRDIEKLKNQFPAWLLNKAEAIAEQDGVELVQERVQNTGRDSEGNPFSDYSEGYKKRRKKKGLETSFKDFTFTTEMWRGFGVKNTQLLKTSVVIRLGGRNRDSQIKINQNSAREGKSIIALSVSEIEQIEKTFEDELHKFLSTKL